MSDVYPTIEAEFLLIALCISRQFNLHQDRRTLLQEMTRDIHQQHNRAQVLCELAACIAAATNADAYNLYLVDEQGEEVFYYKPSSEW
ncbi:hypothetical protein LSH36_446g02009 [Paralvinella palmiformis]|uniref:Uncharacterized protein n=1 Tax=Paralvinella palmiformis TaxID=53620 RepID=A0AAD9JC53_9ANNE|nr:hypothetical protein LSH36_446g02009 [Paralvinella palmiformis]